MLQKKGNKSQKEKKNNLKITIFFQRHKYQDLTQYTSVTTNFKSSHGHHVRINNGKELTLRLLMSHIYAAPILDVSRSHTTTHHGR